jgi:hypothetical protein
MDMDKAGRALQSSKHNRPFKNLFFTHALQLKKAKVTIIKTNYSSINSSLISSFFPSKLKI